jgi:predicted small lipoprotein YifL
MTGRRVRISAAVFLVLALVLGACGRKGDLHPPDGEESSYTGPGTYPAPDSVVPQAGSPAAPDAEDESEAGPEGAGSP